MKRTNLLFFFADDRYFVSRPLSLAVTVLAAEFEVKAAWEGLQTGAIHNVGIRLTPLLTFRRGSDSFAEVIAL